MKKIFLFSILLNPSFGAYADPVWIPPKDTFHTAFSFTEAQWDQYLQIGTSSVNLPGEVTQYEFTTLVEYVPLNNLSFDLTFPIVISQKKFVFVTTDLSGQIIDVNLGPGGEVRDVNTNTGVGDVTFGAKYVFWDKVISLGLRPHLKLPGSYDVGEVPNAPGDGQTDLGMSLLVGGYFLPIQSYLRGSLSLHYRTGEPQNQLELMIEPGVNLLKNLTVRFIYHFIDQFGGDDFTFYNIANFFPANEEDTHRIGVGLSFRANDMVGIFGLFQQTLSGRNTANTRAFTFGVDLNF